MALIRPAFSSFSLEVSSFSWQMACTSHVSVGLSLPSHLPGQTSGWRCWIAEIGKSIMSIMSSWDLTLSLSSRSAIFFSMPSLSSFWLSDSEFWAEACSRLNLIQTFLSNQIYFKLFENFQSKYKNLNCQFQLIFSSLYLEFESVVFQSEPPVLWLRLFPQLTNN